MPSNIEWTDETWNPVTGCTRVSPGCDHCYMYALYPRLTAMGVPGYEDEPGTVRLLPERLNAPLRWGTPRHVFVNSMSDLFHHDVPFEFVTSTFEVMQEASESRGHVFQVLTKRPGRAVAWWETNKAAFNEVWPSNVWIGTSVENQKYAPRITVLSRLPAPVRFVSAGPLLGHVDLSSWLTKGDVQWLIVGGESGRAARPMDMEWVRSLRDQSQQAGVAFFLKQLGGSRNKRGGAAAVVDGEVWREMPDRMAAHPLGGFAPEQAFAVLDTQERTNIMAEDRLRERFARFASPTTPMVPRQTSLRAGPNARYAICRTSWAVGF